MIRPSDLRHYIYLAIACCILFLLAVSGTIALYLFFTNPSTPTSTQHKRNNYMDSNTANYFPHQFVTRSGATLQLAGQPFRFSGANMYWLGLDENVNGVAYPTPFRVDDALTAAQEMGATVVRSHTLGISVGCPLCLEPSLGTFNPQAFVAMDYAIQAAETHHLRLIVPLVDNWHYYHGGKHTFTSWRGISDENAFYTNPTVIHDFEQYISTLLNHVNSDTGLAYKDDPTIMAWETGNEITPPVSWTRTIADYLKSIDPNHLVIDGSSTITAPALALPNVDIYTHHYYPASIVQMQSAASVVTTAHKVFFIGEYAWQSGDPLPDFLAAIAKSSAAGDMYWSFFPHNDTSGYVQHADGFTIHYPGDDSAMRTAVQSIRTHAYAMQKLSPPAVGLPGTPVLTAMHGKQLFWRGTALAASYSVERSTAGSSGPWTLVCNRCTTDNNLPWTDTTQPSGISWYQIQAYNLTGLPGPFSDVIASST